MANRHGCNPSRPVRTAAIDGYLTLAFLLMPILMFPTLNALAITLQGVSGTDVTPAAVANLATTALGLIVNVGAPIAGGGMLLGAGYAFARNRQSGFQAGPAALASGGAVAIASPTIASELLTSFGTPATFDPTLVTMGASINPLPIIAFMAVRTIRKCMGV